MRFDRERADDQVHAGRFLDRNEFDADSQIGDLVLLVDDLGVVKDVKGGMQIGYWVWIGAGHLRICVRLHGSEAVKQGSETGKKRI